MPMNDLNAEMTIDGMRRVRAVESFAKDIARQCREIEARKKMKPPVVRNGSVFTARELRDSGIDPGKSFPDDTKFWRTNNG